VEGERAMLAEHGFIISDLFASTGERIDSSELPPCAFFFVVARKTEAICQGKDA